MNGEQASPAPNGALHCSEDDDFKDIIMDEEPNGEGDKSACVAVNYKVSMEEFQKVDVFQTSTAISTGQDSTPQPDAPQPDAPQPDIASSSPQQKETESVQDTHNAESNDQPIESETANGPAEPEESLTLDLSSLNQPDDLDPQSDLQVKTGDNHIFVNGSSQASVDRAQSGVTTQSADILRAEQSRTAMPEPSEQLLRAQAEWDAVETIQPGPASPGKHSPVRKLPLVSFNEALGFFQTHNMEPYLSKIKPCIQRTGFAALKHWIVGPPKMNRDLLDERNLVFAIAQSPFDDEQDIHKRVLQTIYKQLTGSAIDCPRFGSHWEQIGFQGTDPATDLRACGFLGLLTLLDFVMDSQKLPLAKDIYRLSLHETQNFPFCVMSINMTRIALQTLREEHLSRECNRRKQVFGVVNDFYTSLFYQLYHTWKHQRKTIHDSGFVLKDLETNCKKNPRNLMKNLEVHLTERLARGAEISPRPAVTSSPGKNKANMDFAGVHELEDTNG